MLVAASAAFADLTNGGFETGDYSGWDSIGYSQVVEASPLNLPGTSRGPTEGTHLAQLYSGRGGTGPWAYSYEIYSFTGAPREENYYLYGSAIKRKFYALAGTKVSFDWSFINWGFYPYDDVSFMVWNGQYVKLKSGLELPPYQADTGWQHMELTVATSGFQTISFGIVDHLLDAYHSELYLDNFHAVPEPTSLAGLALGGLALIVRKRRRPI